MRSAGRTAVASFEDFAAVIAMKKGAPRVAFGENIGCIMLRDPFFFEERDWFPAPEFAKAIVVGKGFDLSEPGRGLTVAGCGAAAARYPRLGPYPRAIRAHAGRATAGRRRRSGQGVFSARITDAYGRRCAVTGEKALPVLEAAHIRPVHRGGEHRFDNGLLLRSDVHKLFDDGYVTVTSEVRVQGQRSAGRGVRRRRDVSLLQGQPIHVPADPECQPGAEFLEWHNDVVFLDRMTA